VTLEFAAACVVKQPCETGTERRSRNHRSRYRDNFPAFFRPKFRPGCAVPMKLIRSDSVNRIFSRRAGGLIAAGADGISIRGREICMTEELSFSAVRRAEMDVAFNAAIIKLRPDGQPRIESLALAP